MNYTDLEVVIVVLGAHNNSSVLESIGPHCKNAQARFDKTDTPSGEISFQEAIEGQATNRVRAMQVHSITESCKAFNLEARGVDNDQGDSILYHHKENRLFFSLDKKW